MIASLTLLAYALAATGVLLISTGLLLRRRWRRPDAAELERRRRLRVNRIGRLADGRIVELVEASEGADAAGQPLVVYNYEVRGVEYQSAQDVSFLGARLDLRRVASGQPASVKYDPQNPTNSIILCEGWSGI